jgi:hypothetical protein
MQSYLGFEKSIFLLLGMLVALEKIVAQQKQLAAACNHEWSGLRVLAHPACAWLLNLTCQSCSQQFSLRA